MYRLYRKLAWRIRKLIDISNICKNIFLPDNRFEAIDDMLTLPRSWWRLLLSEYCWNQHLCFKITFCTVWNSKLRNPQILEIPRGWEMNSIAGVMGCLVVKVEIPLPKL